MDNLSLKKYLSHSPVEIHFGIEMIESILKNESSSPTLIVTTPGALNRDITKEIISQLSHEDVHIVSNIKPNPDIEDLEKILVSISGIKFQSIIAIGGGSVIDSAKAIRASMNIDEIQPLIKSFRSNLEIQWSKKVKLLVIPTTSGTGSEVTPYATIWDASLNKKYSLAGDFVYPTYAILDSRLTSSLGRELTLYPGLDATSHALESIWNKNSSEESINIAIKALDLICNSFIKVLNNPSDSEARMNMQIASLLSGIAISKTRTALAHSISYPLTSRFNVPHGLACSFTLVSIIDFLSEEIELANLRSQLIVFQKNYF